MHFLYKFFTYIFYPFASPYLFFRKLKGKEQIVEKLEQILSEEKGWFDDPVEEN